MSLESPARQNRNFKTWNQVKQIQVSQNKVNYLCFKDIFKKDGSNTNTPTFPRSSFGQHGSDNASPTTPQAPMNIPSASSEEYIDSPLMRTKNISNQQRHMQKKTIRSSSYSSYTRHSSITGIVNLPGGGFVGSRSSSANQTDIETVLTKMESGADAGHAIDSANYSRDSVQKSSTSVTVSGIVISICLLLTDF